MTPRRMTDGRDLGQIQMVFHSDFSEMIHGRAHIEKRIRVIALGISKAPVFNVPCRQTLRRQGIRHVVHEVEAIKIDPTAAVNHDHDRKGPVSLGQTQFAELFGASAISNAHRPRGQNIAGRR